MIHLAAIPWRLVGRIALGTVVLACVLWIVLVLKGWHDAKQALPAVRAERDAAIAETRRVRKDLAGEIDRLESVNEDLLDEKEALRAQRDAIPVRAVRLCRSPAEAGPALARDPAAAGRDDGAGAGARVLPPEAGWDHPEGPAVAGVDIGADLYALADEADELLAAHRALQAYVAGLPKACAAAP
jgi:hypothetical protein